METGEAGLPGLTPVLGELRPSGHLVLNRAIQHQTPARHPLPGLASQDRVRSVISTRDKTDGKTLGIACTEASSPPGRMRDA